MITYSDRDVWLGSLLPTLPFKNTIFIITDKTEQLPDTLTKLLLGDDTSYMIHNVSSLNLSSSSGAYGIMRDIMELADMNFGCKLKECNIVYCSDDVINPYIGTLLLDELGLTLHALR